MTHVRVKQNYVDLLLREGDAGQSVVSELGVLMVKKKKRKQGVATGFGL